MGLNFRHVKRYAGLFLSDFLSEYATSVASTTVKLWLLNSLFLGSAQSSKYLSLYLTLASIGELISGIFAGAFAERFGIIKSMLSACLVRAVASLGTIGAVYLVGNQGISPGFAFILVTVMLVITSASSVVYFPAAASLVNRITESEQLVHILSLLRFTSLIGSMLGPAIAGFAADQDQYLLILFTEFFALLLAGLAVVLVARAHRQDLNRPPLQSAAAEGAVAESTITRSSFWGDWVAGMKTIVKVPLYRSLFPFALIEAIATSGIGFAVVLFFSNTLNSSAAYGYYSSAVALGYALSYLSAGFLGKRFSFRTILFLSQLLVALMLLLLACAPSSLVAVIAGFLFSYSQGILGPIFQGVFIGAVDEKLVSQVMSVFISVVGTIGAVSYPLWSTLYEFIPATLSFSIDGFSPSAESVIIGIASILHAFLVILSLLDRRVKQVNL